MVIPSLTDPSVAPPGKHVMSCFVQYAPYKLAKGTWDDQREAFGDTVINTIAEHAPNIKKIITGRQILTPLDLEREFGLTQGNIFQGELSLEQLFFLRPVPGLGILPHAHRQPLYVRFRHASGRRHHGRPRTHRQPGHSQGLEKIQTLPFAREQELIMPIGQRVALIGGGHNALITAFYLAKGGFKPLILERREMVGGGAITEEFHPGFRASTLAHTVGPLRSDIARDLELQNSIAKFSVPIHASSLPLPMANRSSSITITPRLPPKLPASLKKMPPSTRNSPKRSIIFSL